MTQRTADNTVESSPEFIVGIGASAGGLQALHDLFDHMPATTGFAFVIVQHLSPDYKSLMVELLAKHTPMPVYEAKDGMVVQANCIYAIPSKKIMTIREGRLHLAEKMKDGLPNTAIDVFFTSLAQLKGQQAVGIVLSGTGTDGTRGIEAIKQHGGIVVVQEPISAAFDGMPNSAVDTGLADLVLPPTQIPEELVNYLQDNPGDAALQRFGEQEEASLQSILDLVQQLTGHDFSHYKRPTLIRRLTKRMTELGFKNIDAYRQHLETQPGEIKLLDNAFLINVTNFFRDPEAFEAVRIKVLPALLLGRLLDDGIKVWVAACSSGEEAYSIAILFQEFLERHALPDVSVKIFATDIDADALETASRGLYSADSLKELSSERVQKFFVQEGSQYRVAPALRKMVIFASHDLCNDPPFSRMDFISCRNMLIYTELVLQKRILRKFHFALNLDGFLLLGPSENLGALTHVMQEIERRWQLYRCISKANVFDEDTFMAPLTQRAGLNYTPVNAKPKNPAAHLAEIFRDTLLESQRYAGILIDREFNVKQAIGAFHHFLQFPQGILNFSLLKLVSSELAVPLGLCVRKAFHQNEKMVMRHVKTTTIGGEEKRLTITVKPWMQTQEYQLPFLFVVLEEEEPELISNLAYLASGTVVTGNNEQIEALDRELQETRASLQAVIEQMETANEELQSVNEEAISTNEELQSTNEELQSLNEELRTVSAEYQLKIKELLDLNDDMNNYFQNSDVAQILVDRHMTIRKFSPSAARMVNLIESDVGRSIEDLTTNIPGNNLAAEIKKVMRSGQSMEKEITLANAQYYLMRLVPYLRRNQSADGVVVNFINITESKRISSILEGVFNSSTSGIMAMRAIRDGDGRIVDYEYLTVNQAAAAILAKPVEEVLGQRLRGLFPDTAQETLALFEDVVENGRTIPFVHHRTEDGRWFGVVAVKMLDGLITTFTDITDHKKATDIIANNYETLKINSQQIEEANTQLERANLDLQQFASVASHDLKEPLRKIRMFGSLLESKIVDRLAPGEQAYLHKIILASERMHYLIEDVLTLSKLSNSELHYQPTDLGHLVAHILEDLEITIQDRQAKLEIGPLPAVSAVPGQMRQLFQNLISNALKFNDKPQPTVRVAAKPVTSRQAKQYGVPTDDYVCIEVSDNGIGFENEYRDKIFGLFQRLGGRTYDGTGIGLAIVKKIVENHGGVINAEGEPGKGARFSLLLPLSKEN